MCCNPAPQPFYTTKRCCLRAPHPKQGQVAPKALTTSRRCRQGKTRFCRRYGGPAGINHVWEFLRSSTSGDHISGFMGHRCPRRHRNADIRAGERWGSSDAVAHMATGPYFPRPLDHRTLSCGQQARVMHPRRSGDDPAATRRLSPAATNPLDAAVEAVTSGASPGRYPPPEGPSQPLAGLYTACGLTLFHAHLCHIGGDLDAAFGEEEETPPADPNRSCPRALRLLAWDGAKIVQMKFDLAS